MKDLKHTEASIIEKLNRRFPRQNVKYKLSNSFVFKHNWESDFFLITNANYTYEIEVKVTRSDFFADFKKTEKHDLLKTKWAKAPNKFFYCVPEGLISVEEVPEYAGLMYVKPEEWGDVFTVKEAPWIHKTPHDLMPCLANKFYHKYMDARSEIYGLKRELERLTQNTNTAA